LWLIFQSFSLIPSKQLLKVVTVGTVSSESIFVKQPLNAAAGADLVGHTLGTNGPTHFAVPAAAQDNGGSG
jgi:hypothetical protein